MKILIVLGLILPSLSFAKLAPQDPGTDSPYPIVDDGPVVKPVIKPIIKPKVPVIVDDTTQEEKDALAAKEALAALAEKAKKDKKPNPPDPVPTPPPSNNNSPKGPSVETVYVPATTLPPISPRKGCQRNAIGFVDQQKRHDELVRCNTLQDY